MELLDLSVTQIDVPSASDALEELDRPANLVVSAFDLDANMKGFEFGMRVKNKSRETSVIILGDVNDPAELDEETMMSSPFVYLSRPVDIHQFLRVLVAGLEGHEAMLSAMAHPLSTSTVAAVMNDMGPVPSLDIKAAQGIIDKLMIDLGVMAILMASRNGEIVIARGATSQISQDDLTYALAPIMMTNINVKDLVGGQVSTVQLYDGDDYDVFVLSVGLHHFLCLVFRGQQGSKQFGMVNRLGRQAVQDLIALLGANAFFIQPTVREEPAKRSQAVRKVEEEEPIVLEHAEEFDMPTEIPLAPTVMPQLEPIQDLDVDALFGTDAGDITEDLFDLDNLEKLAKESQSQNDKLGYEEAKRIGLLK
ncbi:MAG: hypothetical protein OHK0046_10520 [Anaerolineae bacterium]